MKSYPTKFKSFLWKIVQMGTLQKLQNSIQTLLIFWPVYPIHRLDFRRSLVSGLPSLKRTAGRVSTKACL